METKKITEGQKKRNRRAAKAGLEYVNSYEKGYGRIKDGKDFAFLSTTGKKLAGKKTLKRIEQLSIPPAWSEVWICPKSTGHVQARGLDAKGRLQYIYHSEWSAISAQSKFDRMHLFAELLPRIRRRVRKDISASKLDKECVVATVIRTIDKTGIRIGNRRYVDENGSRGAATLAKKNVDVAGFRVSLDFSGKSGKRQEVEFSDAKVAKVIENCEEISGQFLFGWVNDADEKQPVTSTDINSYLKSVAGDSVSAKDFRTWWGSVTALSTLDNIYSYRGDDGDGDGPSQSELKKWTIRAIDDAAEVLGNTRAVCRSSYVHPGILASAESDELPGLLDKISVTSGDIDELTMDEIRFAKLLPYLEFS